MADPSQANLILKRFEAPKLTASGDPFLVNFVPDAPTNESTLKELWFVIVVTPLEITPTPKVVPLNPTKKPFCASNNPIRAVLFATGVTQAAVKQANSSWAGR